MKKIKIQPKHRRRTYDEICIPEIKMEGKWLEELGFKQGKHVKVEWRQKKIIITLIEDE
ncbi:SymE family type I addiction module toxin [Reichenbachiella versicolor]|uniref:SymE family type I addiction module toxin n=1 Tax=Reichenbachiella versicolor TaxID=1821036 RepID=UPI000D6E9704|nr:SymE family type I addiction module toxin [Reichenbachiella versicolor]